MNWLRLVAASVSILFQAMTASAPVSAESLKDLLLKRLEAAKTEVCTVRPERFSTPMQGVTKRTTILRAGPGPSCDAKAKAALGIRLQIIGAHGDWYYASGTDSSHRAVHGWLEKSRVDIVRTAQRGPDAVRRQARVETPAASAGESQPAGEHGYSRALVAEVQAALNRQGYDAGSVDGAFGPATAGALRTFQGDTLLAATGRIDTETLVALGVSADAQMRHQALSAARGVTGAGMQEFCASLQALSLPRGTRSPPCPYTYTDEYVMECFVLPMNGRAQQTVLMFDSPASARPRSSLAAGERFSAVARQDLLKPCPMQVVKPTRVYPKDEPSRKPKVLMLTSGEVVFHISYIGEGMAVYWQNGQMFQADDSGLTRKACLKRACWAMPLMDCREDEFRRPLKDRWFRIETATGRTGWIRDGEHIVWDEKC